MHKFQHVVKDERDLMSVKESSVHDSESTLIFVFFSELLDTQTKSFEVLESFFPKSTIVGCSTAGEIAGSCIYDSTLTVTGCKLEKSRFTLHVESFENTDGSYDVGAAIGDKYSNSECRGILLFSDGLNINGSDLVRGVNDRLTTPVNVSGGLAGDGSRFGDTYVYYNGILHKKAVIAIGFYGESLQMTSSYGGGWDRFGPQRIVTKSNGPVLFELDDEPALELYKRYLGEKVKELPGSALLFPLLVTYIEGGYTTVVRTILTIDENLNSMTFAGNVPEGAKVQLMKGNFERLIDASGDAARVLVDGKVQTALTLVFSCVGRRLVLGERTVEELEFIEDVLPEDIISGFYTYGEICPSGDDKRVALHNETMTLARIWED